MSQTDSSTAAVLFNCAMALFQEEGYDAVSVKRICEKTKLTRNAFYYHYPTKEALLISYFDKREGFLPALMAGMLFQPDDWQRLRYLFREHMRQIASEGLNICRAMLKVHVYGAGELMMSYKLNTRVTIPLIAACQAQGHIRADIAPDALVLHAIRMMSGVLLSWCSREGAFDLTQAADEALNLLMLPRTNARDETFYNHRASD